MRGSWWFDERDPSCVNCVTFKTVIAARHGTELTRSAMCSTHGGRVMLTTAHRLITALALSLYLWSRARTSSSKRPVADLGLGLVRIRRSSVTTSAHPKRPIPAAVPSTRMRLSVSIWPHNDLDEDVASLKHRLHCAGGPGFAWAWGAVVLAAGRVSRICGLPFLPPILDSAACSYGWANSAGHPIPHVPARTDGAPILFCTS